MPRNNLIISWENPYGNRRSLGTSSGTSLYRIATTSSDGMSATKITDCYAWDYDGNQWGFEGLDYQNVPNIKTYFYQTASGERFTSPEPFDRGEVIPGLPGTYNLAEEHEWDPDLGNINHRYLERITIEQGQAVRTRLYEYTVDWLTNDAAWDLQNGYAIIYAGHDIIWFEGPDQIKHVTTDAYLSEDSFDSREGHAIRAGQWLYQFSREDRDLQLIDLKSGATQTIPIGEMVSMSLYEFCGGVGSDDGTLTVQVTMHDKPTIATFTPEGRMEVIPVTPDSNRFPETINFVRVK